LWRGSIYAAGKPFSPRFTRQRIYHGPFGAAAYQSVYRAGGYVLDLAHQVGVPLALASLCSAPFGLWSWSLGLPRLAGRAAVVILFVLDVLRCVAPPGVHPSRRFRAHVAMLHLLQPVVRTAGRFGRRVAGVGPRTL